MSNPFAIPNGAASGEACHTSPLTCVPVYKWKHACECLSFLCGSVCLWEVKPPLFHFLSLSAPPEWSVMNDPAFSRKPRCAKVDRAQHCSCDAGFHMSGTSDNSICQGGSIIQPHLWILAEISGWVKAITAGGCPLLVNAKCIIEKVSSPKNGVKNFLMCKWLSSFRRIKSL